MASSSTSPRRLRTQNSLKKQENGMDSPFHPGRHPLRPIPESSTKSSSTSEQSELGSPARPRTPRGKKRAAAVYRQSENVDGNIGSASNTPEKPREKRTTLTRVTKMTAPWPSKLPVTASLARSLQESLQQTDAANKSWESDPVGGTPTTSYRTSAFPTTGASKAGSIDQTPHTVKFSGKPPLDSEPSRTWVSSSNSSFLQSTPSRSVNRSLRYGATPGSAASIGSTRASGSGKSSGLCQFYSGQQILAQQFDFEEDPTFWEDHNVQVILRTRPISTSEAAVKGFSRCVRQENSHSITWIGQPETRFTFDHVAGEHITQEKLFRVAGVPMVENCMAGYNSCMFCYGQTGSGKTHTMLGDIGDLEHRPSDNRGITPRVFEYLFSRIQKEEEARIDEHLKYVCKCSFLEIFNEQITDLLEPTSTNLQVREGGKKGVYVENLSEVAVGSVQDVVHLLLLGSANRKVAATNMNRESSRSHSVFTCTIESKWEFNSMTNIRFGRLNLVDLAGSERQKNSGAEGERLKEAAHINKSLSTLGLVIMILVDVANGKQRHVPYRDSKLTYLLQDSLGGNSKTTMIANISPSSCCALETLSTLKFAQRAKFIRNNAVVNEDASGDVNGLRQEIQELKEELDRMRRQDLPRTPSMHSIASVHQDSASKGDYNLGMTVVAVDEQEQSRCSFDSWDFGKAFSGPRFPNRKLEAMEAVLAGALRREQEAELSQKRQAAEIEQLTRLVKQREDDNQCSKMLLRFREDKITRLEALSAGITSADMYLRQEKDCLMNELRLMQEKADRNPELTRFAMENIRLLEQLRRFQDFYSGGEREAMADEISNLRDQLLEVLDSKLSLTALTSPQREALAPELAAAKREIELLRIEADNYRREVEDCRKNLSSSLEANSKLTRQLDESSAELREVMLECQIHQDELQKLRDQALEVEAIEWGHAQHVELISNLKIKLQQSEDRSEREASMRSELDEQLNASLLKAADLQAELQESREALDAAEMLVSRLQSAESSLSVAQEMATLAQNAVRQIHLETKEMAEDQRLSLKHIEDAAVAACIKESEFREELNEAHSLIEKLSSTKDDPKCLRCAKASLTEDEQVQQIVGEKGMVTISQLEQDLKSLDLLLESGCTYQKTTSIEFAREGLENIAKDCDETSKSQGEQPSHLEHSNNCILKLNFGQEELQRTDDGSLLGTTTRDLQAAQLMITDLQEDQNLQVLQRSNMNPVVLETARAIRCLLEEIVKLKPQVLVAEQTKAAVKVSATELVKELQSSILVIQAIQGESKNWAAQNEALLKEKDMATRARREWEAATSRLVEHLNEGEHALTDAVREMEGILDDSLRQPTALDRERERERLNVQELEMTTTAMAKQKESDQAIQGGGNDQSNSFLKRNFAICTTMLSWFSETLTVECTAKDTLLTLNERAKEELEDKDCLISSLQLQLERSTVNLFEKDSSVSKLHHEQGRDQDRLREAEAQVAAVVNVQSKLLDDIEKHRLEHATVLKRMEDAQVELAPMQNVLTRLQIELIGCERNREDLAMEKEQLAAAFSCDRKILERSCTVASTMVWWLQNKMAADEEAQKLNYDEIVFQVSERDKMVMNLQNKITENTMLLNELMGNKAILINQNLEHVQEIDNARKELATKDSLLGVMQTNVLRLQEELSASEGQSLRLAMEKETLQLKLRESANVSTALEGVASRVQRDLAEAEAKVVELATVQAGMLIVQEEWELEKGGLVRDIIEAKQRCTQLEHELELARSMSQKFETEVEEAKTQEAALREERDAAGTNFQEELTKTQISAEAFKDELESNRQTMAELESRLQKHLTDWEIEKETMFSAAMLAHDQCLEKDQALAAVQASHALLQSQLYDGRSRETKLSHELEELLQLKENTQSENEMLRSKAEELNQQGHVYELKLQKADDKVEDTHRQMKAILENFDALILMKENLEADTESIEQKILHHCSSIEQQLVKAQRDKNQVEDLSAEREIKLLGELNTVKSENVSLGVRIQTLEDALEDSRVLIKTKEEEVAVLRRQWTDSESKAVQMQEKLRASTLLVKELARSDEQWKLQKEALAAENKRLTRCMACREMEFSSLQGQKEGLEKSLKEAHEKESLTNITLSSLKEDLKVLEKQWQVEREQLKDRLGTVNRELVESQEQKHGFYNALKELEEEVMATEKKCELTTSELETQWNTARGEMSSHLTQVSQDFIDVKRCAEQTHQDLANSRSLLSAADAAIEQLLKKSSVLEDSNKQLRAEQEALQLELSHWEQYAVELHESSCFAPSPSKDDKAVEASGPRPLRNYFDLLKREVDRTRRECENLRAEVLDKDSTLLSVQMELSSSIASSRQVQIELKCVADERSDLKLQLNNINGALANTQDEVRCREVQLELFEGELHKVMEILVKTEEKMDESAREWRKQIEEMKAEMETAKLCAIEKGSEVTMLRRQFEQGQATLQEAELLVNALVRANDSAKLDVLKWKSREEKMALQSCEMLSVIEEEVSVSMDHVEKNMQVLGLDIHGMRTQLTDSCSEIVAGFGHEFKEFTRVQISEIERVTEEANMKLSEMNAKVMDLELRLHKSIVENETLQITLNNTEDMLTVSQAALEDAMQNIEAHHRGWAATRDELQGALTSLTEKDICITESTSECNRHSARITELETLFTKLREELTANAVKIKAMEMEKLTLVEATHMLQAANNHLHGQIQQLEMSVADDIKTKQLMEMEISSLRQQKDSFEDEIHKLEADLAVSHDALKAAAAKLLETDLSIQALNTDLGNSHNEVMCVQRSLDNAVTELNDLRQHAHEQEEKEEHLRAQAETQRHVLESTSDKLVQVEANSDAAMGILATMLECTSRELHDKEAVIADLEENRSRFSAVLASLQVAVSQLGQEKEFLLEKASALDDDKKNLLGRLELLSKQLCKQSQEASDVLAAHELQLEILKTIIESASSELQEKDHMMSALREKLEQGSAHCLALDDERNGLLERLEMLSEQLCTQSQEASDASFTHQVELDILKTAIESASSELQEKDHMMSALREKLEQGSAHCLALDDEKNGLLERLEILSEQLCTQSQEASAASFTHQVELDILKTAIESASSELQEKDHMMSALREKLKQGSAHCLALDDEKNGLLERLEILSEQLCTQSQEASAASFTHQVELDILKTAIESASSELQEKDHMMSALREKLEQGSAHCLALDDEKNGLLERLEMLSEQLCTQSQEASAASFAHQVELDILKTAIESASSELQEKDRMISILREHLEEKSVCTQKMLNSVETAMIASAQIEHERDELREIASNLEAEIKVSKEEVEMNSRKCSDLEMQILRLQSELQDVSNASSEQKLELEIVTTMLESTVKESREKDAMAADLENLLSQSQLQNAEMLQSSQEVVNHFSLFQSQLDACFQQNRELERNKLVLTAEVHSQSLEIAELKEQQQASEKSLDEMRASLAQLKKQKDEEVSVLSDELEKLKSQEAVMEADLWDWEQRCQDTEVQLDEKDSELEILRGKLLATQEECKEQVELMYAELRGCQLRIAEMDSERLDLMNEIEEGSAIVAELQEKLQTRENDMEDHFSRHSIEQEVLDSLENEKRELQSSVKHLIAEVASNQQRATAAENIQVETRLEMEALERDLKQKDDLLQSLESDLNLLQESALQELRLNQELDTLRATTDALQQELNLQTERRTRLEIAIGQVTEEIVQIRNQASTWKGKAYELETELDKKRQTIESLEDELRVAEQNMANTLEEATIDLKDVENDRDRLHMEVLELTEQLEMTQAMVEERDVAASELHQAAELSKANAKEKENEANLLSRSVEELESTVYALESQLGLLKREAERQRLLREDIEMESQRLKNHIFVTQSALEESNTRNAEELKDALSTLKETERKVEEKESEITHLRRKLENLEIASKDKDIQINDAMAQISDLLLAAEVQKADFQQKLKRMEIVIERSKTGNWESQSGCTPYSNVVATEVVSSDANSAQEALSQRDIAHVLCQCRIKELEELASSRQKEVFTLNTRLAEAESMTHDVLRDLLGVKTDMSNVVSMLGHQQIQHLAETARRKSIEAEEMEAELSSLRSQINTYIEERERWAEEINQRQCEMVAARVAAEKLRQREQVLTDEIEKFRIENINHQEKIRELEMEIRKLPTGEQTFYQQINHHAKIKEENQALKLANENLSKEVRRTELLYAGMRDEVIRYRDTESKSASSSLDEEHHLRHLLQEAEDSRAQAARKLSVLCTAIMQAAGLSDSESVNSSAAMEALHLLENRLRTTEQELSDSKHKMKFTGERRRRTDIRAKDSPLRSISNFTDLLQRASSQSPAPR